MTCIMNVLQMSQLQAQLDEEWKGKSQQMLTTAKVQHSRELAELTEQKDALQKELTHLQEKVDRLVMVKHKYIKTAYLTRKSIFFCSDRILTILFKPSPCMVADRAHCTVKKAHVQNMRE